MTGAIARQRASRFDISRLDEIVRSQFARNLFQTIFIGDYPIENRKIRKERAGRVSVLSCGNSNRSSLRAYAVFA
jgi:hypothetical protein